ncbi:MAG: OmpH family outer membrane protein [Gammaproteobacteria bacterium]|nr:OmpH family outer membrane protein [Gammaproteobacteria bacterium]MBT3860739.1 OmpH family outer membrane protein [Gammaproteobacteria bacterium]MBT3985947.1 OmpH family outer membrane protein [Gammaproteobacteria bacterium]MBT4255736.1 OmpH family outer membrane protein [Gammaproteobacteria bacterium]MBT4582309.1 OmpH family outer membrane protein [Gammaproteobacteria bacterium]
MKIFRTFVACISLVLISQGAFAQDTKIGVLNALQALFNSDAAQVVQEELEQEFSVDEARAQELNEELQALAERFQKDEAVLTDSEKTRINSDAQNLQVQLQLIQERVQTALQAKNQEFLESMQPELAAAVTDVVAEGGYDLIVNSDSIPYFAPVLDITAKVTAKLNESSQAAQ